MHIHFVGIGGIGVSALAKYHLAKGDTVSGSDLAASDMTRELEGLGVAMHIGAHKKVHVPKNTGRVIGTAAARKNNEELLHAQAAGIPTMSYAAALGELSRQYQTIAIAGSHGKSTTTAMTALILKEGYCDPTVIVGTKVKEFGNSNFRKGMGSYLVLEADEFNRSFLHYTPTIAVVNNIDAEHLDTYKRPEAVEEAFRHFLSNLAPNGVIVANADDERTRRVASDFGTRVAWFSLHDQKAAEVRRVMRVPGEHNVSNALAALTVGELIGVDSADSMRALGSFRGTWRRFDFRGVLNGAYIFDDYGHHPREVVSTLAAARAQFPWRRLVCVFQPHHHHRLASLWNNFVSAFDGADLVGLLPVYAVAGREQEQGAHEVSSEALIGELRARGKQTEFIPALSDMRSFLHAHTRPGDVVLMMGAGDIYTSLDK